jgi:predicted nucleotidyltransferase
MGEARELPALTDDVIDLTAWVGGDPLWRAIAEIAAAMRPDEWLLIGGQMVALHGFVAGTVPPRATTDIDIVAAVLVRRGALDRCVGVLESMDLRPQPSVTGKSLHRFAGDRATVDLVVPDHLPKAVVARIRGYSAVPIAGTQRALDRAGRVAVTIDDLAAEIVTPDLQGAIVLKGRAAAADRRDTQRHISDVAFLCSLVADPLELARRLDAKERQSLRRIQLPDDTRAAPWVFLDPDTRLDALDCWRALRG